MRRWILPVAFFLVLGVAAWPLSAHADGPPTVHEVASELMCQCGCGLVAASCQESMTCSVADDMVQEVRRRIDDGSGKQEILDYFASAYGEQVLALPRKSGFSLTAWTTPFLAVAAGAVVVSALVWLWVRRRPLLIEEEVLTGSSEAPSIYEERVDQDLELLE